jgi:uncharacterized coiled-coil protein SlyX
MKFEELYTRIAELEARIAELESKNAYLQKNYADAKSDVRIAIGQRTLAEMHIAELEAQATGLIKELELIASGAKTYDAHVAQKVLEKWRGK